MFVVCDYIASLSFVPKWQGLHKTFEKVWELKRATLRKIVEVEQHWECAKERQQCDDTKHVAHFVNMLVATP
jgi:hypothetical protein